MFGDEILDSVKISTVWNIINFIQHLEDHTINNMSSIEACELNQEDALFSLCDDRDVDEVYKCCSLKWQM